MSSDAARRVPRPRRNPVLRAGVPLVTLVVLGSLGLAQLMQARATGSVVRRGQGYGAAPALTRLRHAPRPGQEGHAGRAAARDG